MLQKPTGQYWSVVKQQKNPCILSPFHQNKYVTVSKKKAELFNCLNKSSELPFNLCKKTDKSISTITFTSNDITTLIQNLDPNKAHGHDKLGVRILKLCGKSICKRLDLIFKSCIIYGEFPTEWKKANVVTVHKKVTNRF